MSCFSGSDSYESVSLSVSSDCSDSIMSSVSLSDVSVTIFCFLSFFLTGLGGVVMRLFWLFLLFLLFLFCLFEGFLGVVWEVVFWGGLFSFCLVGVLGAVWGAAMGVSWVGGCVGFCVSFVVSLVCERMTPNFESTSCVAVSLGTCE